MVRPPRGAPGALVATVLLLACLGRLLGQDARPAGPVAALVAGEPLGSLEPCHCTDGMLGGFPRRLSAIERVRAEGAAPLVLEGGDLSAPGQTHPGVLAAKTRAALDLLRLADAQPVAAVGELDLRLGPAALLRAAREAGVSLVCANLRGPEGAAAFPASARVRLPGGRVAWVVGALDPELGDPSGTLRVGAPAGPVREALAQAPAGALRVLLFHGARERVAELLERDLPADLIVCGHRQQHPGPAEPWGQGLLVETGRDARALVRVDLRPGQPPAAGLLPLDEHVPDAPSARTRIDAYYAQVRDLPEAPRRPTPAGGSFVGAETCRGCHPQAWEVFAASLHHGAQARVEAADPTRGPLPECTRCHVTGWGFESGYRRGGSPDLAEVSCEACHGVGGDHAAAPPEGKRGYGVRAGFPASWEPVCRGCHDPSNSPGFELAPALEKIRHWERR